MLIHADHHREMARVGQGTVQFHWIGQTENFRVGQLESLLRIWRISC
jgi:hypothetical protein